MTSIITPPRVASLEPKTIRIIVHTVGSTHELAVPNVFPFCTLYGLKQRIAIQHVNDRAWLPKYLFLASEREGQYKPLEFTWPFTETLDDPLNNTTGAPNPAIYKGGERQPVFPTILSAITLETAVKNATTIHAWTLKTVATAVGLREGDGAREELFEGFIQLYFPGLKTADEVRQVISTQALTAEEREVFEVAEAYTEAVDIRMNVLQANLTPQPTVLRDLRFLRYTLPSRDLRDVGFLEMKFYETEPTERVPFVRFFPAKDKHAPLIKLATKPSGMTTISDKKLLDILMSEEPATTMGAVMLLKAPVQHPRAPAGTAWTLRIYEDGSVDVYIGAPRKDSPLPAPVVIEAVKMLPAFLAAAFRDATVEQLTLVELTAAYELKSDITGGKPSKTELKQRLDVFLPVFMDEKGIAGDTADLHLRYKAVSNFVHDRDPIISYITTLFLRDSNQSVEAIPVDRYIAAISKQFGIPPVEASNYMRTWLSQHAEYVSADKDSALAARNLGAAVGLYNNHPKYIFLLSSIESQTDLNRILALLGILVNKRAEDLQTEESNDESVHSAEVIEQVEADALPLPLAPVVGPVVPEEAAEPGEAVVEGGQGPDVPVPEAWEMLMNFGAEGAVGAEGAEVEPANMGEVVADGQELAPAPRPAEEIVEVPKALADDEVIAPVEKEWYLRQLGRADRELFEYKEIKENPRVKIYSVGCQKSGGKQPNVMDYRSYQRARTLYGDAVFWLEAPLSAEDALALKLASKTPNERAKEGKLYKKSRDEVIQYEKRALILGIPLVTTSSKGTQITSLTEVEKDIRPEVKLEIAHLIAEQQRKPLWSVVRTGTQMDEPNYYICAELWCVRDDLPLIPEEFRGTRMRNGTEKFPNSCAFCGGRELTNATKPQAGETVLRRKATDKAGQIAQYAGFQKNLYHPSNYALPCCFTSPNNLDVPVDAAPIPPPKVPLPDTQIPDVVEAIVPAGPLGGAGGPDPVPGPAIEVREAREPEHREDIEDIADADNRDRPFSPLQKHKTAQNKWYIPNQNMKGRDKTEWVELEKGTVAVPPPAVNALLGQNPETFLTKQAGVKGGSINAYLAVPGTAFIRYSIGNSAREPGKNLISLIAYAKYATAQYKLFRDDLTIGSYMTTLDAILGTDGADPIQVKMVRAFLQANYGTLLHEFSTPGKTLGGKGETEGDFQAWWAQHFFTTAEQRAYGVNAFLAWNNFKNYIRDTKEMKDMRLWEGLFAVPGLLTETGFVVVRIRFAKDKEKTAIVCPEFGVSIGAMIVKPPVLFVVEDEITGFTDPLVFYFSETKEAKHLLGVLEATAPAFRDLSPVVKEPLQAFLTQFYSADGCGRAAATVHPWIPLDDTHRVPLLSALVVVAKKCGFEINALLHDRSNRCVGVILNGRTKDSRVYIPALDDGTILLDKPVIFGEDGIPKPTLQVLLETLTGSLRPGAKEKGLAHKTFIPGLKPARLLANATDYFAVELACGAIIPVEPQALASPPDTRYFIDGKEFTLQTELFKGELPWITDKVLLGPTLPSDDLGQTDEETLEEAYQYLRISFSNWLLRSDDGARVRKQIEQLRQDRRRLPLYELQKRLEILLTPIVNNSEEPWMTLEGKSRSSVLRRDCRQITKERDCGGGCAWSSGQCLIHTASTPRYVNPLRVLTVRLVDELLRTFGAAMEILNHRVPRLKPVTADSMMRDDGSVLFSAEGRGSEHLYERLGYTVRKPGAFSRGLTFPEETGIEGVVNIPADWLDILRKPILGAEIARDAGSRLLAILASLRGRPITRFSGTRAEWVDFAKETRYDIIRTRNYEPDEIIVGNEGAGATQYIILDADGIPLQRIDNGKYISLRRDLPARLAGWIEAHGGY